MKRIFCIIMILTMVLGLVACGGTMSTEFYHAESPHQSVFQDETPEETDYYPNLDEDGYHEPTDEELRRQYEEHPGFDLQYIFREDVLESYKSDFPIEIPDANDPYPYENNYVYPSDSSYDDWALLYSRTNDVKFYNAYDFVLYGGADFRYVKLTGLLYGIYPDPAHPADINWTLDVDFHDFSRYDTVKSITFYGYGESVDIYSFEGRYKDAKLLDTVEYSGHVNQVEIPTYINGELVICFEIVFTNNNDDLYTVLACNAGIVPN